ncbi:MAG: hypothetical protein ACUVV6_09245 [Thermoplasmatota archaeon]
MAEALGAPGDPEREAGEGRSPYRCEGMEAGGGGGVRVRAAARGRRLCLGEEIARRAAGARVRRGAGT